MGLSDEERLSKMVWSINSLTNLGRELQNLETEYHQDSLRAIIAYTKELWHAYLGGKTNGAFWLLGGDFNNPVTKEGAPWSTAIMHQCAEHRAKDPWSAGDLPYRFDPFDGFLDVEGLLPKTCQKKVYQVYGWTEQLSYALRRYDDELMAKFQVLNKLISDIQGACFDVFQKDTDFGKAYVGNRLLDALYRDKEVAEVFNKLNLQHSLGSRIRSCELKEVIAWDLWRIEHKPTRQNAIVLALRICGPDFHYKHELKRLEELTKDMGIKAGVLNREFEKCLKAKTDKEKKDTEGYRKDHQREAAMAIHGFDVYKLFEEKEEASAEDPPQKEGFEEDTQDE